MGREQEARQAYERCVQGVDALTGGGSDDWTPDNFFMVLALDRLGRHEQALQLVKEFRVAANSRLESEDRQRNAAAHYLNGLIDKFDGKPAEAGRQMQQAIAAEPDYVAPRFEVRGDVIDRLAP
jgi:tetratricopeptide (TPR) repeat protein